MLKIADHILIGDHFYVAVSNHPGSELPRGKRELKETLELSFPVKSNPGQPGHDHDVEFKLVGKQTKNSDLVIAHRGVRLYEVKRPNKKSFTDDMKMGGICRLKYKYTNPDATIADGCYEFTCP